MESHMLTLLRFFDEGLKVIFDERLSENYGCSIKLDSKKDSEEDQIYCIFRFTLFLEDFFALRHE